MTSLLRSIDLTRRYGRKDVVRGVSLEAKSGEVVGLLGPNGAGKTTTFSMVAGFVRPTQGKVFLDELDLTNLPAYKRARNGLVYLPQDSSVFRKLTVEENVRAIVETLGLSKAKENEMVEERLAELRLTDLSSQKAFTLSGGERRRLEITRALVLKPKFLMLDEPFSGVDPISVSEVVSIISNLKNQGNADFLLSDPDTREKYLGHDFEA
jgi:lipopolysaccharide export system ATP-binding protein